MAAKINPRIEVDVQRRVSSESRSKEDASAYRRTDSTLDSLDEYRKQLESGEELPYELPAGFLLSIVVPVFNEQATIRNVIGALYDLPVPIEVIAVDDGSTDGSTSMLTELNKEFPALRVCIQEQNQGKGAALRRGFEVATGSHVMVQDADLEYDPVEIPALLEPIVKGAADVVYGSRFLDNRSRGSSAIHRWGNRALTLLSNCMTGLKLTDMETCYKIVRRDLLQNMNLEQNRFGFEVELTSKLAKKKARIVELPISYSARDWSEGKKIGWRDAVQAIYCIVRYH